MWAGEGWKAGTNWGLKGLEGSEGIWNIQRVPDGSGDGFGRVPEELRAFERFWW